MEANMLLIGLGIIVFYFIIEAFLFQDDCCWWWTLMSSAIFIENGFSYRRTCSTSTSNYQGVAKVAIKLEF